MGAGQISERADFWSIFRRPSKLEWRIARRYLRSRRSSSAASLNTVISAGGVMVGVMALIVVLGVMNGLRNDLRERILVANPHLRVLTFRTTKPNVDGGILLGARLANRISVYPGDVVTLVPVTQAKVNPALGVAVPRFWRFEVTGLFDTGMFQYDNQFVVLSRELAQRFTGLGDAVSGIAVRVQDP